MREQDFFRRLVLGIVLACLAVLLLSGLVSAAGATCVPALGRGVMGVCTPVSRTVTSYTLTLHGELGVDVSSFQGYPDWAKARRAGLAFAIPKAGEGGVPEDSSFVSNWRVRG